MKQYYDGSCIVDVRWYLLPSSLVCVPLFPTAAAFTTSLVTASLWFDGSCLHISGLVTVSLANFQLAELKFGGGEGDRITRWSSGLPFGVGTEGDIY